MTTIHRDRVARQKEFMIEILMSLEAECSLAENVSQIRKIWSACFNVKDFRSLKEKKTMSNMLLSIF